MNVINGVITQHITHFYGKYPHNHKHLVQRNAQIKELPDEAAGLHMLKRWGRVKPSESHDMN